jgi:hypothetical protein
MRTILATALLGTAVVALPSAQTQNGRVSDSANRPFQANGRIVMDLSAGEYRISASPDNSIALTWRMRDRERLSRVDTRIDVRGAEAEIEVDGPGGDHDDDHLVVDIAIPARSDLRVRLSAGELEIEGITGNKDVSLHAGEMTIEVGRASDYRRVDAAVWAGEVNAGPFGRNTGGLFRSVEWDGPGSFRLDAHVKAGEIHLR